MTDAGLKELKELKQLTSLNLGYQGDGRGPEGIEGTQAADDVGPYGYKVTDAGVKELKELKQLSR